MAEQAYKVEYAEGPAAVQDYLDFMLREATEPEPEPEHEPEEARLPVPEPDSGPELNTEPEIEPELELEAEPEPEPEPEPEEALQSRSGPESVHELQLAPEPEPEYQPEPEVHSVPAEELCPPPDESPAVAADRVAQEADHPDPEEAYRVPPEWAETEFPSLLFRVRGMDMAAPLIHLGGIANISDETLQPVAGQAPWFIGLMRWNGRTIRVIDTARLLTGEKAEEAAPPDGGRRRGYESVVVLHGTDWGLAVDGPGESRRLDPGDIRWRHQRGGRPWLAGTLSGRLCSLLDTGAIIGRLAPIAPVSRPDDDAPSLAQNLQGQR